MAHAHWVPYDPDKNGAKVHSEIIIGITSLFFLAILCQMAPFSCFYQALYWVEWLANFTPFMQPRCIHSHPTVMMHFHGFCLQLNALSSNYLQSVLYFISVLVLIMSFHIAVSCTP